jgi:peptide/nickel transport system permease protein
VQFIRFSATQRKVSSASRCGQGRSVSTLLKERLPATLELSAAAAILALCVGIPLGVYTALRQNGWLAQFLLAASLVGVSLPTFLIGIC